MAGPSLPAGESGFKEDPEARKRAIAFQKEGTQEVIEAVQRLTEGMNRPRKPTVWDAAAVAANIEASEILTPAQKRARQLGYELRPDGSLVSSKLERLQEVQRSTSSDALPTDEETEEFMRQVEEEEEADYQKAIEEEWNREQGNPSSGYAST
jgi:hypothetical protein